jgi:hypothetical protein
MTLDQIITVGIVAFSGAAGFAWLRSATSEIKVPDEHGKPVDFRLTGGDEPDDNQLVLNGVDVWRTTAHQSKWNMKAAAAACVAAFLQGCQAIIHWGCNCP